MRSPNYNAGTTSRDSGRLPLAARSQLRIRYLVRAIDAAAPARHAESAAMRRRLWFGSGWDHPDLLMGNHVRTPAGQACLQCGRPIEADDQGLVVNHASDSGVEAHLTSHPVHIYLRKRPMPSATPFPYTTLYYGRELHAEGDRG